MHVLFTAIMASLSDSICSSKMNTSDIHGNDVKQLMCLEQTANCFRLNPRVFANNNVKLHYLYHSFDSHNFTR